MLIYLLTLSPLVKSLLKSVQRESITKGDFSVVEYRLTLSELFIFLNKLKTKADLTEDINYDDMPSWVDTHKVPLFNLIKTTIFFSKQEALEFLNEKC